MTNPSGDLTVEPDRHERYSADTPGPRIPDRICPSGIKESWEGAPWRAYL